MVVALGVVVQPTYAQTPCDEFQLSGAIFTTDQFGEPVNMNIYNNKRHVYLDGGPGPNAPTGAAALPLGRSRQEKITVRSRQTTRSKQY